MLYFNSNFILIILTYWNLFMFLCQSKLVTPPSQKPGMFKVLQENINQLYAFNLIYKIIKF